MLSRFCDFGLELAALRFSRSRCSDFLETGVRDVLAGLVGEAFTCFGFRDFMGFQVYSGLGIWVDHDSKNLEKTSSHCRAREKSFSVIPPSSCVVRVNVTWSK
jgi:hypothetical protein